ncbi:MAG TPA: glycosyltransferase [candidate division Zixibacteria bacterium]|nr:glycosyltransferase [candidate division Zixibacteria bacterium]
MSLTANMPSSPNREVVLSVVVPCFNEEACIHETNRRLLESLQKLSLTFEIIYVDDGSKDSTLSKLRECQAASASVRVLSLSRNFGHQAAITAGLEHSAGKAVVIIDADLQDPPEVIGEMVNKWLDGWDVVYGTRTDRDGETMVKLGTAKLFYRFLNLLSKTPIPLDTGDFRLMDRAVVDALLSMPERDRFIRGMVSWVGFKQSAVQYRRAPRFGGETKYSFSKMLHFALDGIFSFSIAPLKVATWVGFAASLLAIVGSLLAIWNRVWTDHWVVGWTSLFLSVLLLGGIQLICIGIIGEYVGRSYREAKKRPLYFLRERIGFDNTALHSRREFVKGVGNSQ